MRGLLAIEPLYQRIKLGYKTQTRRSGGLEQVNINPGNWEITGFTGHDNALEMVYFCNCMDTQRNIYLKPRYKMGEILFLKEPWKFIDGNIIYAFDRPNPTYASGHLSDFRGMGYENKLFMPASYAREYVRIAGIKCERLLDISDADCIAEGIEAAGHFIDGVYHPFGYIDYTMRPEAGSGYDFCDNTPKQSFISLYKLANKMAKYGSSAPHGQLTKEIDVPNIWVWAYTFEYLKNYKQ